ncbi:hypothetical protein JMJ35_005264 [Cladonia borealis]|uniref:Uncharacterized protein n=1 Tax=Cladonia borealis TaxID=184061 RepID=A0AA39R2B8_9LECA|nr:hypothetical protein JMJ35_005264 [Cladonia borealis]
MTNNRNDKDTKAAIPAPYNLAIAHPRTQGKQVNHSHVQLDRDPRTNEQLLEDLREKEGQLNDLATKNEQCISFLEQVQTKFTAKEQELKEITDKSLANASQKNREIDEIRQMWKQAAKELEKYQAQDKVVDQVTDPEVTEKARQIQYNVRNFAYQHFGGELNTGNSVQNSVQISRLYLQKCLQIPPDFVEACIKSPVKCPMLVGACVWDFLLKDIFEKYWWAGTKVHRGMVDLTEILSKPCRSDDLAEWSEAKRKYQMWKANTSTLLVNALKLDREEGQDMSGTLKERAQDLCAQLAPLTKSKYRRFTAQIFDIIREALDLDQLLSKQVADIFWTVGADGPKSFNEASMELQQAEKRAVDGQQVQLVVAPGLIKKGRSTGEDYEMTNILLRITVSCEPITTHNPGESHTPPSPKSQKPSRFTWITEPLKSLRHDSPPRVRDFL